MNKRIGLKDIASAVGVSTALVSYVLNNKKEGRINKAVAEKIRAAARTMNYRTNQLARSLKTNRSHTIGLVLADISNPFSAALARVIEDEADRYGYTVIFGSSDENAEKHGKILDALANRQADGMILSPPGNAAPQITELLKQDLPLVLVDRYFPHIPASYIILDNHKAAYNATQHLVDCGYRKICLINYDSSLVHLQERTRGFEDALEKNGLLLPAHLELVRTEQLQADTELAVQRLVDRADPADALLFGSNVIAMHAVKYLDRRGFRIPDDIALTCFDETDAFDLFYAPLSCIRQPIREMGERAVRQLVDKIEGRNNDICQQMLEGELIVRASTRPRVH